MESLKEFPEEYGESCQTCFLFLKNYNIRYLEDNQSFIKKNWRFVYIVPAVLIHILAMGAHITVLLNKGEMAQVAYVLPPFLICVHATIKGMFLIPETAEISSFIRELGAIWRTELTGEQIKEKEALLRRLNFCNRVNYWVTWCGSIQYLLSPLVESLVRRFILHQDCELVLPIASTYPFDQAKNWLIFIPVYIFQVFVMFLITSVYKGSELILITLCALLGIEFKLLEYDLTRVKPSTQRNGNPSVANDKNDGLGIEQFVKRHQKLICLSRQLDNIFNRMIFIDLLFVGITTCAFSFAGEFSRGPTYMLNNYVGVASLMFTVLYLCYYGEQLTGASSRMGVLACQTLWYKGDKKFKTAIWLIMKISQKPCCLTSLKYAAVSLNLFTKVVSTTWSYFSLMNTVFSEGE